MTTSAAAPTVMMALGDFRFSIGSAAYEKLQRVSEYRWAAQDRLGREPAQQYLGPGRDEVELNGTIYPTFRGGLGQVDKMREMAGRGDPLILVDGRGVVWGKWCISSIHETQSLHLPGGLPRKVEFKLTLVAYGEDDQ